MAQLAPYWEKGPGLGGPRHTDRSGLGHLLSRVLATGSTALTSWKIEFDLPAGTTPGSYWDATMISSGNHYTFSNREYNGAVAAGGSVTFGFLVTGSEVPQYCKINGHRCDTSPTSTLGSSTEPDPGRAPGIVGGPWHHRLSTDVERVTRGNDGRELGLGTDRLGGLG